METISIIVCVTFIFAMFSLFGGCFKPIDYIIPRTNYGPYSCTELGSKGH